MKEITFNQASASGLPNSPGAYMLGSGTTSFYVGSSNDLQRRTLEHLNGESNPCLRRKNVQKVWYQTTRTEAEARAIEREWYRKFGHECNEREP